MSQKFRYLELTAGAAARYTYYKGFRLPSGSPVLPAPLCHQWGGLFLFYSFRHPQLPEKCGNIHQVNRSALHARNGAIPAALPQIILTKARSFASLRDLLEGRVNFSHALTSSFFAASFSARLSQYRRFASLTLSLFRLLHSRIYARLASFAFSSIGWPPFLLFFSLTKVTIAC